MEKLLLKENRVYLQRKLKVILPESNAEKAKPKFLATLLKNLESLGFTFSPALIEAAGAYSKKELSALYEEIVPILNEMVGAHVEHRPFYPNFPRQVMNTSQAELYLNAIVHYATRYSSEPVKKFVIEAFEGDLYRNQGDGTLLPVYDKKDRLPLFDTTDLKIIELGNREDFFSIFKNLLTSRTSISEADINDLSWFFEHYPREAKNLFPAQIPHKENMAIAIKMVIEHNLQIELTNYFKTATDVLRLATVLSSGDISLAENTHFISFPRRQRVLLLQLLEQMPGIEEDMIRYKKRWLRLGERLHPGEYRQKFFRTAEAFDKLRSNKKIETFYSRREKALEQKAGDEALQLLKARPGEFARRLDQLIRNVNPAEVMEEFAKVAPKVSVPVLLQVMAHFKSRPHKKDLRVFFPKGRIGKAYGIEYNLPPIAPDKCEQIVKICQETLKKIFAQRDPLGLVYVDPELKDYPVPFALRSASGSLRTIARGSKMNLPPVDTIRAFLYWKGKFVDIDLSAVFYSTDWQYLNHISYTNLRSFENNACHSGDITSAPQGASEFIDINIPALRNNDVRYIVLALFSFSGILFSKLEECFMGWMERQYIDSGEIYEPKTVKQKIDIAGNTLINLPAIFDLKGKKVICADLALPRTPRLVCLENNRHSMALVGKAMTSLVKPTLADLFTLHAESRGVLTRLGDEADIVFSVKAGTPFAIDDIVANYL
jgi:hypothetical protein